MSKVIAIAGWVFAAVAVLTALLLPRTERPRSGSRSRSEGGAARESVWTSLDPGVRSETRDPLPADSRVFKAEIEGLRGRLEEAETAKTAFESRSKALMEEARIREEVVARQRALLRKYEDLQRNPDGMPGTTRPPQSVEMAEELLEKAEAAEKSWVTLREKEFARRWDGLVKALGIEDIAAGTGIEGEIENVFVRLENPRSDEELRDMFVGFVPAYREYLASWTKDSGSDLELYRPAFDRLEPWLSEDEWRSIEAYVEGTVGPRTINTGD